MAKPLWLFDMDGTVIDVNSFPLWVRHVLHGHQPYLSLRSRVSVSARCAAALLQRKLLRGTHHAFRKRLQQLWAQIEPSTTHGRPNRLTEQLLRHVRPNLRLLLDDVEANRADAILTTAAAAEYVLPFARRLGFRHVVATPAVGGDDIENVGEVKRERTLRYITARGWSGRPLILFTDHLDDLPLMREAAALIWFGSFNDYGRVNQLLGGTPVLLAHDADQRGAYEWVQECSYTASAACM